MNKTEPVASNERREELLQPDVMLPAQFFRALRGREAHGGERRLIIAVLEDAINCFQKNLFAGDNRSRRLFHDAENWVMSTDRGSPFAFENICEFLSLDAEYIRQGLCRWARSVRSGAGPQHFEVTSGVRGGVSRPVAVSARRAGMVAAGDHARASFEGPLHSRSPL
jgi:nitrite reductase/ring-hydroxylating ferredoxin subunit